MRTVRVAGEHGAGCVRAHSSSLRSSRYFAPPLPIDRVAAPSLTGSKSATQGASTRRTGALATRGPGELSLQVDPGRGVSAAAERSASTRNYESCYVATFTSSSAYCGVAGCESAMRYCIRREKGGTRGGKHGKGCMERGKGGKGRAFLGRTQT